MNRTRPDLDLPDLTGRRVLLTGGSDGIGLVIATRLAGAGADVVLPVRDRAKGEAALAAVRTAHPAASLTLAPLDLASLESVAALGETLRQEGRPLHALIANAGVMTPPERRTTTDGLELQLGTNHVGHVALVSHLLPLLREGRARITVQASVAAARGRVDWDDLGAERVYDAMAAYRRSKIMLGLFGLELDRVSRARGWGVSANVAHPGVAPTSLLAARPELGRTVDTREVRLIRALSARGILVGTPASAALPALLAATAPDAGGRLFSPRGLGHVGGAPAEQRLWRSLRSADDARRAWEMSEELARTAFPAG